MQVYGVAQAYIATTADLGYLDSAVDAPGAAIIASYGHSVDDARVMRLSGLGDLLHTFQLTLAISATRIARFCLGTAKSLDNMS